MNNAKVIENAMVICILLIPCGIVDIYTTFIVFIDVWKRNEKPHKQLLRNGPKVRERRKEQFKMKKRVHGYLLESRIIKSINKNATALTASQHKKKRKNRIEKGIYLKSSDLTLIGGRLRHLTRRGTWTRDKAARWGRT